MNGLGAVANRPVLPDYALNENKACKDSILELVSLQNNKVKYIEELKNTKTTSLTALKT